MSHKIHIKGMSDKNDAILAYYDEMEWRIIHSDLLEKDKYLMKSKNGHLSLIIHPKDIKIIVFPNVFIRKRALEDPELKAILFNKYMPMITTIYDCKHF